MNDIPMVLSFSGGRTSGYMLYLFLRDHLFKLPPNSHVIFCNTGKEREETLDFVERCSLEWEVPITWLEYAAEAPNKFWVVNFATASRKGEPFESVIKARSALPNLRMRFCTGELKIRTTNRYLKSLGVTEYTNAIGLRFDEPNRVGRLMRRINAKALNKTEWREGLFGREKVKKKRVEPLPPGEFPYCPLFEARVKLDEVMDYWKNQPFDLALTQGEGNCDLCFLKGASQVVDLIRARPESADWWIAQESKKVGRSSTNVFRKKGERPSYTDLKRMALGLIPATLLDETGPACECRCTD